MNNLVEAFWINCVEKNLVVVPFMAYSKYDNGNLSDQDKIGLRFVAMGADLIATIDANFYLEMETSITARELIAETPEEAVTKYLAWLNKKPS